MATPTCDAIYNTLLYILLVLGQDRFSAMESNLSAHSLKFADDNFGYTEEADPHV